MDKATRDKVIMKRFETKEYIMAKWKLDAMLAKEERGFELVSKKKPKPLKKEDLLTGPSITIQGQTLEEQI